MAEQKVISGNIFEAFQGIIEEKTLSRIFLICGKNVGATPIGKQFVSDKHIAVVFQDFEPNPSYESVVKAVSVFRDNQCDGILAIGGGSAMDVAKCVKAFAVMDSDVNYLQQPIMENQIPYYVVPTTAGTGSEATRFAVIYYKGEKQSVEDWALIPDVVFMESSLLTTLPLYQKKVTMLDALCHSVESFWSVHATKESQVYAEKGLQAILKNYKRYLDGDAGAAEAMLVAAYYAGKAINISKTTAAHAMCYKLTKLYDIPHGQAAAICLSHVWEQTWLQVKEDNNQDLTECLQEIAKSWDCSSVEDAIQKYREFLQQLGMQTDMHVKEEDLEILTQSVNTDRLKNHPVTFSKDNIRKMYTEILERGI